MSLKLNSPARNTHLLDAIRISAKSIVDEILNIDYALLNYKRELERAQPKIHGNVIINFIPTQQIRGEMDIEPVMARFYLNQDKAWVIRDLKYPPGKLHEARAFGKDGMPMEQDSIVVALLKEIDTLLQLRSKLLELTRPLRQNANGLISHSKSKIKLSETKIDKISPRILIDWSNPGVATELATQRQALREERATRKLEKAKAKAIADALLLEKAAECLDS